MEFSVGFCVDPDGYPFRFWVYLTGYLSEYLSVFLAGILRGFSVDLAEFSSEFGLIRLDFHANFILIRAYIRPYLRISSQILLGYGSIMGEISRYFQRDIFANLVSIRPELSSF